MIGRIPNCKRVTAMPLILIDAIILKDTLLLCISWQAIDDDWRDENDKCQHYYCANETAVHRNESEKCSCPKVRKMACFSLL